MNGNNVESVLPELENWIYTREHIQENGLIPASIVASVVLAQAICTHMKEPI